MLTLCGKPVTIETPEQSSRYYHLTRLVEKIGRECTGFANGQPVHKDSIKDIGVIAKMLAASVK